MNGEIAEFDAKFMMPKIPAPMTLRIAYIVSDFAESLEKPVSNIWLSIIQLADFVDEENDILKPSIRPE